MIKKMPKAIRIPHRHIPTKAFISHYAPGGTTRNSKAHAAVP